MLFCRVGCKLTKLREKVSQCLQGLALKDQNMRRKMDQHSADLIILMQISLLFFSYSTDKKRPTFLFEVNVVFVHLKRLDFKYHQSC